MIDTDTETPIKKRMMDFDYYQENLIIMPTPSKILLWQCEENEIFIKLTFKDWWKIKLIKEDQAENLIQL